MLKDKELNSLILKVNRICFSDKFRSYWTSKYGYCPSGLTFDVYIEDDDICYTLMIKNYGYEHSSNNGISEYSDLYDYDIGNYEFTDEQLQYAIEYFATHEIWFYQDYMMYKKFNK